MKNYTKKDFEVTWFSGTGAGGQYRNKHQNCCRITHIETGLRASSQEFRERLANQAAAFKRLAAMLIALDDVPEERRNGIKEIVRTYHCDRNEATDHSTGIVKQATKVLDGELEEFVLSLDRNNPRPSSGRA